MKQSQILPSRVTYINTKGKKNRTVPISEKLFKRIPKIAVLYSLHLMMHLNMH